MADKRWMWEARTHPRVLVMLAEASDGLAWCSRLETAAVDATVGKMLCVCVAAAVSQQVLASDPAGAPRAATEALELLTRWIDDPTDDYFERIRALTFGEVEGGIESHGVVWWALRTATSSVGNQEAAWALESTCNAARCAGLSPEQMQRIAKQALSFRQR